MPQGIVKPSNQIVAAGDPLTIEMEVGAAATPADMLPGRVVIFDAVDQTVKEAGAKAVVEVGVLDVVADKQVTDAYAVGDHVLLFLANAYAF